MTAKVKQEMGDGSYTLVTNPPEVRCPFFVYRMLLNCTCTSIPLTGQSFVLRLTQSKLISLRTTHARIVFKVPGAP